MSLAPREPLRADRIQASIYPGFSKDEQAFLWLRFPGTASARGWLTETLPEVTRALDALAGRRGTWVNVAFSKAGLDLLTETNPDTFPDAFAQGMAKRAALIGDTPATWRFAGTPETEAHALVIVGADDGPDLLRAIDVHLKRLERHRARDLFLELFGKNCRGAKLPNALRGHEHFGYRDGISEPRLDGSPGTGDFLLGYPDASGNVSTSGPPWTRDGSYLVFRRLRQDVAGFHRALDATMKRAGLKSREQVGAKLVGRWPSGAKLGDPIEASDAGTNEPKEYTAREFAADPNGEQVPLFAHVRKAHPQSGTVPGGLRHQLLRRGIPYGPPLLTTDDDGLLRDDNEDRGLFFLAYQVDVAGQYERVQRWLNDPHLPVPDAGQDPIAGQGNDSTGVVLRSSNAPSAPFDMQHYVSMTGGGYFFTPSLSAVRFLADPTIPWEKQEAIMGDFEQQLGDLITRSNPYGPITQVDIASVVASGVGKNFSAAKPYEKRELPADHPLYMKGFFWALGKAGDTLETVRVSKAMRIRYQVAGTDYYLVIGYEGGGGM